MAESVDEKCRTCLHKETHMISLLADHVVCDKVMSVLDLLKTCTSIQIEYDDGYPQFVCLNCINSAEKSYEFRDQCEKADIVLKSQIELNNKDENFDNDDTFEVLEPEFENPDDLEIDIKDTEIKCEKIDADITFSCLVCNLNFPTTTALTKHSSFAHPPNFFQCPLCPVRFINHDLLDKHIIKHNQTKKTINNPLNSTKSKRKIDYICAICGKKYASLANLNLHIRKHSPDKQTSDDAISPIFICHECDHHFVSASDLQTHMEKIHNLKNEECNLKHRCKFCLKNFTDEISLKNHVNNFHDRKQKLENLQSKVEYKCKICSENAKSLPEIKDHLSTHDVASKAIFNHLLYRCSECEKVFKTIYDYFTHSTVHGATKLENTFSGTRIVRNRPYKCNIADCDKTFPSPSALKKHSMSHETQWPKKCRYCDCIVNKWYEYMTHLNNEHDDKKTFICTQCGKKFFKERNLQSHMKTHSGERNYMCDFCGFSFQAQNNLVAHRRIHTGVKPYKCTFCPQAFSQHAGLRSHLLNHNGEKKHECPTCRKKFLRIGALKNHIKTHTGVKDYACHICGARFGASSTRKKHLLTHTGERNHVCDFCGKAFSRRSNLSVHRKIHTGETPHVCQICGKGFIQAHVLRSHLNTHRKHAADEKNPRKTPRKNKNAEKIDENDDNSEEVRVLVQFNE